RIKALDIAVVQRLWEGYERRACADSAILQFGIVHRKHKAIVIVARLGTRQFACAAVPCSITHMRDEIIGATSGSTGCWTGARSICWTRRGSRSGDLDIYPPGFIRLCTNSEQSAVRVLEHPVATIRTSGSGSLHINRDIDSLSHGNILWERSRSSRSHLFTTGEYQLIGCAPCASTDILQAPGLGER